MAEGGNGAKTPKHQGRGEERTHNLKFDRLAFEFNSANLEIDANCGDIAFCVGIVCKTEEEAGLGGKDW